MYIFKFEWNELNLFFINIQLKQKTENYFLEYGAEYINGIGGGSGEKNPLHALANKLNITETTCKHFRIFLKINC